MAKSEKLAVTDKQFVETTFQRVGKFDYLNKSVSSKKSSSEIAEKIKNETWESIQEFNIDDYVSLVSPGEYAPNMDAILQSRPGTYNSEFVESKVQESLSGENYSRPATLVFFPEDTVVFGIKIDSGTFMLIGGCHGMVIDRYLGMNKKFGYVVNFKEDLNSDEEKLNRLANLLNVVKDESQQLPLDAIKLEIYRLMDRRIAAGLDGKPSDEERKSFLEDYRGTLNDRQWTNYISNHKFGGRSAPRIEYSRPERTAYHNALKDMKSYENYVVSTPSTVISWSGETLARAMVECCDTDTRKLLMPLYARNIDQVKSLETGTILKKITTRFAELKEFYHMEEMKFIIMKY